MSILDQLGLDHTFFIQFAIFIVLFAVLKATFFKPVLKLFDARHKRVVEDKEAAQKMLEQADARFEEYKRRLAEERAAARAEQEQLIAQARKAESEILGAARNEARRITQEAADSVNQQRAQLQAQLSKDVESLAQGISEKLLVRRS